MLLFPCMVEGPVETVMVDNREQPPERRVSSVEAAGMLLSRLLLAGAWTSYKLRVCVKQPTNKVKHLHIFSYHM